MKRLRWLLVGVFVTVPLAFVCSGQETQIQQTQEKSANADSGGASALGNRSRQNLRRVPRSSKESPGWDLGEFPDHAVCYKSPAEIRSIFENASSGNQRSVVTYQKPSDGSLRVVGLGHSFMVPGYRMLPLICRGAGIEQLLHTHTGGGRKGSARYKWEQENGIYQFDGKPFPKLLSSICSGQWDAMMFAPYYNDRPAHYSCWIDFCLKYNPDMKFYLSDGWPQLEQFGDQPESEAFFTEEVFDRLEEKRRKSFLEIVGPLREAYPGKVFVLPTSGAMVLAAKHYLRGELPGIEGLYRVVGKKSRSLWSDQIGHLGPGFERLEGYVFYATLYGKSPEGIQDEIDFGGGNRFPSPELDRMFRKIAWRAVVEHSHSGVIDKQD